MFILSGGGGHPDVEGHRPGGAWTSFEEARFFSTLLHQPHGLGPSNPHNKLCVLGVCGNGAQNILNPALISVCMRVLAWCVCSFFYIFLSCESMITCLQETWKIQNKVTCSSTCCSVAQSCPPLCDPMDCSTPGSSVLHQLLRVCSHSRPLRWRCCPTISSSVALFFCFQSFPASGSFSMKRPTVYYHYFLNR